MNTNDHYVPQFLLRRFNNSDKKIHVFDKWESRDFATSTRNVASEKGFYDIQTDSGVESREHDLTALENYARPAITAVTDTNSLAETSDSDRARIAVYLSVQMLRTRAYRDMVRQMNDGLIETMPTKSFGDSSELDEYFFRNDEQLKSESISHLSMARELYPHLLSKAWILNSPPPDESFLISDNPLVKRNFHAPESMRSNGGLASPGIQIYFPLSPGLILSLLCPTLVLPFQTLKAENPELPNPISDAISTGCTFAIPSESVVYCNSLQISNSTRFVFSCDGNFELAKEMVRSNPELRRPCHVAVE